MYACLYDEDRWPSGFAGGKVTQIPKYRQRFLILAREADGIPQFFERKAAISEGKPYLIGCYDVKLSDDGFLEDYRIIAPDQKAEFEMVKALPEGENLAVTFYFEEKNSIYVAFINKYLTGTNKVSLASNNPHLNPDLYSKIKSQPS